MRSTVERWSARVEGNAEQVDRMREAPDESDFYATVSRTFVADPGREDDPVLQAVLARARPDDRWLDIGAGAGRYALPVARRVRRVVAVDPSDSMLRALRTLSRRRYVPPYVFLTVHSGLANTDSAISWARRAVDERDTWAMFIPVTEEFDVLKRDPRYAPIVAKMGVPMR